MGNPKITGRAMSMPAGLAIGAAVSMAVTVAVSFIGAQLVINEVIPQEQIGFCALAALMLGAMLGAITSDRKIKSRRLLTCAISGAVYCAVLLGITALFFGARFDGVGATVLTVMLGCTAAALLPSGAGKNRKCRRRKKV